MHRRSKTIDEITDPAKLVRMLLDHRDFGDRKLRLIACAVCRSVESHLVDPSSLRSLEAAEAFCDGRLGESELGRFHDAACTAPTEHPSSHLLFAATMAKAVSAANIREVLLGIIRSPSSVKAGELMELCDSGVLPPQAETAAAKKQELFCCNVIRDIGGPPLTNGHPMGPIQDVTVKQFFQNIYNGRQENDVNRIRDFLKSSSNCDRAVLDHYATNKRHFHGCWIVDALAEKEVR